MGPIKSIGNMTVQEFADFLRDAPKWELKLYVILTEMSLNMMGTAEGHQAFEYTLLQGRQVAIEQELMTR